MNLFQPEFFFLGVASKWPWRNSRWNGKKRDIADVCILYGKSKYWSTRGRPGQEGCPGPEPLFPWQCFFEIYSSWLILISFLWISFGRKGNYGPDGIYCSLLVLLKIRERNGKCVLKFFSSAKKIFLEFFLCKKIFLEFFWNFFED